MNTGRAPSMNDVARVAGVALVTVSRVLNDDPAVRDETRAKVRDAVALLGYRRNDAARVLKRGKSATIGVVLFGSELNELGRILLGMETAAREAGFWLNIVSWQGEIGDDQIVQGVQRLSEQLVEGIVMVADRSALSVLESLPVRVPISLVMSGEIRNPGIGSVEVDQYAGAALAMEHLIELGHRDIAHVSGSPAVFDAQARLNTWRRCLESIGESPRVLVEGDFSPESGYAAGRSILSSSRPPTAIFVANDRMALGVLAAAHELGVRVPHDVSIVGFDDFAGAGFFTPSLTTVRQDHRELGWQAVQVLLGMVAGETPRHHLISPDLIVRSSTSAPSA